MKNYGARRTGSRKGPALTVLGGTSKIHGILNSLLHNPNKEKLELGREFSYS